MKTLTQTTLCLLALVVAGVAVAATVYVDDDAPSDPGPGDPSVSDPDEDGSADHPYDAIQEGIDSATTGDEVVVAAGTYTGYGNGALDFDGKEITLRSADGPTMTVIALESGKGFDFHSGETDASVVDGFGICNATDSGVYCLDSSPTVSNCIIWSCDGGGGDSSLRGGGVHCEGSNATITSCVIWSCTAHHGGGISCVYDSSPTITNCLLWSNAAYTNSTVPDGGGGIYSAYSSPTVVNCTIAGNWTEYYGGGFFCDYQSSALVVNSIVWGNSSETPALGSDIAVDGEDTVLTLSYSDAPSAGIYVAQEAYLILDYWIDDDPLFVEGPLHDFYLSQVAAGQEEDSPCVDTGDTDAVGNWVFQLTTRTDSKRDENDIDMGYHAPVYIEITDVYWDQVEKSVVITFTSEDGVTYDVQAADADEYNDSLSWSTLTSETASGDSTTVTDDLDANPLDGSFRFYRIKRQDYWHYSPQTVGVFEKTLTISPATNFISVPLIPDPDHDAVADVFGEKIAGVDRRQVPNVGFQVGDLDEPNGVVSRMRLQTVGGDVVFVLQPGAGARVFNIEAGVGYEVLMAGLVNRKVRFIGYVPDETLLVDIQKVSSQAERWMAYSMPRDTTLDDLGLPQAVTTWRTGNRVRLLQPGSGAWNTYAYDTAGEYWYLIGAPGVPVNPPIPAGLGIVFVRADVVVPTPADKLPEVPWYAHPPNTW